MLLISLIGCLANNIIADLGESTEGILNSVVDNVFNVTDCVSDQVVGAITNGIVGKVGEGMSGALGGLDKILDILVDDGGFNVENIIRQTSTSPIAGAVGLRGCNAPTTREISPCRYRLGYGPVSSNDADLTNILGNANAAAAISNAARLTGFPLDGIQDIAGALDIFNSDMKVLVLKVLLVIVILDYLHYVNLLKLESLVVVEMVEKRYLFLEVFYKVLNIEQEV